MFLFTLVKEEIRCDIINVTGFDCDQSKFFGPDDQMLALGGSAEV